LHAAGQTQGAENTVFSFAYPGKKAMSREIFPGKFYAAAKNGGIALNLPVTNEKIISYGRNMLESSISPAKNVLGLDARLTPPMHPATL